MKILLIGVDHHYQHQDGAPIGNGKADLYLAQYARYARWVREHITRFEPQLIFDEMNLPDWSPVERLQDTHVPWIYMDIPQHVRSEFWLTAQRGKGKNFIPRIDEPREKHWQLVIESISSACKVETILVLCGAAHLPTFSKKLLGSGHSVEAVDLREESWVDLSWYPPHITPEDFY